MNHFKPILCGKCGTVVWSGISWAGFRKKLDTARLTIEEEIIKRVSGLMTYELHRTQVSFEAVERTLQRIQWAKPSANKVIVADHHCSTYSLFGSIDTVPDYWARPVVTATAPDSEEFPF